MEKRSWNRGVDQGGPVDETKNRRVESHPHNRGLKILGIPVGQPEYVRKFLEEKVDEHQTLFQRIPVVEDPQAAWLLLLISASTRANFWLRGVQPEWTAHFAETMMHMCGNACARSSIPKKGNQRKSPLRCPSSREELGLISAARIREGAHWANWAVCLKMVRQRHPTMADTMIQELVQGPTCCFEAVRRCDQSLTDAGFEVPSWTDLAESQEVVFAEEPEPHEPKVGWQQQATKCLHQKFWDEQYWVELTDAQKALMLSQRGPLASAAFTIVPTNRITRIEAQPHGSQHPLAI